MKIKKYFLTISLAIFMVFSLSFVTTDSFAYWTAGAAGDTSDIATATVLTGDWAQAFPWDANTSYLKKDIVTYNGSTYSAKSDNINVEPEVGYKWWRYWKIS